MSAIEVKSKEQKTGKVKIYKPDAFIIDFHGTICSIKWEDEVVLPYVIENLNNYLIENWQVIDLMNLIERLRQDSFIQRFKYNRNDAPLVEDDSDEANAEELRKSVCKFVTWQIANRKETQTCISLQRLIWRKGMLENKLKTIVFDDVPIHLKKWSEDSIKLYIVSSVLKDEIQLFLKYTSHGDLTKYITDYFDDSIGKRIVPQTYQDIAMRIPCDVKNLAFITDSGKEAKIATEVGVESLLILRPKNFRIREYYLTCFQSINSFDDIELIPRKTKSN